MAMTPEQIEEQFAALDFTQGKRRQFVDKTFDKALNNEDPEMLTLNFKVMADSDKVSLGRLKINEKEKENQTRADESDAMAKYLVSLSERRQAGGLPEATGHSNVIGSKLPAEHRPTYDPSVRDAAPGSENTTEFSRRMEENR